MNKFQAERTRKAAEERESERREMMVRDEIDIGEAGAAALIEHDADEVEIQFMLSLLMILNKCLKSRTHIVFDSIVGRDREC